MIKIGSKIKYYGKEFIVIDISELTATKEFIEVIDNNGKRFIVNYHKCIEID